MLFSSFEFLLFLPVVFCLYWFVFSRSVLWQNLFVIAASYFFYGWLSYYFLGVLVFSTICNYLFGFAVNSANRLKAALFLWLSIICNVGLIAGFKYFGFFDQILGIGLFAKVIMPVGLSFYTLHAMSYIFDVYRGEQKPVNSYVTYSVFQGFFPLLLAGPLERMSSFLPQVQSKRKFNYQQAAEGGRRCIWGMFKKMVIANNLAPIVAVIFNSYRGHSAFSLIIAAVAFSIQVYADVSGYADIAIGTAKLLGFELSENFRFPYFSRHPLEFWTRWHITFTSWFRDYVYKPVSGMNKNMYRKIPGIVAGFAAMAVWHYASWKYIAWAGIHAAGVLFVLALKKTGRFGSFMTATKKPGGYLKWLQILLTFVFICSTWVFFRAKDVAEGYQYLKRIITNSIEHPELYLKIPLGSSALVYVIPFVLMEWWLSKDEKRLRIPGSRIVRYIVYYLLIVMAYFMLETNTFSFIYFRF